jgi:hypothetical protein
MPGACSGDQALVQWWMGCLERVDVLLALAVFCHGGRSRCYKGGARLLLLLLLTGV